MGKSQESAPPRRGRRRGLKARQRSNYDNSKHGRSESSLPPDDRCINEGSARVQVFRPKWSDGPLVFRPWPMLDYDDPENKIAPPRRSAKPRHQEDWIVRATVAKYVGLNDGDCERATFILHQPGDKQGKVQNPYRHLYFAAKGACDNGSFGPGRKWDADWNKLLKGSKKGGAALSRPSVIWFVQAECYRNGDKDYLADREVPLGGDPADDLVIIEVPGTAGEGLMELLDVRKENFDGDEDDREFCAAFKYGSAVGHFDPKAFTCGPGLIVTVFNPNVTKNITKNTSWDGKIADTQGYEVAVSRKYRDGRTELDPTLEGDRLQQVFDKWSFWWDDPASGQEGLLRVAPVEQQALWVARAFRKVPKLIKFAWADHDDWFTDEVNAILNSRSQGVVPGKHDDEDGDLEDEEDFEERRGKNRRRTDPTQRGRDEDDSDDEDEDEEDGGKPARNKPKSPASGGGRRSKPDDEDEDDEEDEFDEKPARGKAKASAAKNGKRSRDEDEEDDDFDEEDAPKPSGKGKQTSKSKDDDFDEEEDDSASSRKRPSRKRDDDEDEDEDDEEDEFEDNDEDEDEEEEKPRSRKGSSTRGKKDEEDEEDDSDDSDEDSEEEDDSDDEDDEQEEDDSDEEDDKPAAKNGRAANGKRGTKKDPETEAEDEDDDSDPPAATTKTKKGGKGSDANGGPLPGQTSFLDKPAKSKDTKSADVDDDEDDEFVEKEKEMQKALQEAKGRASSRSSKPEEPPRKEPAGKAAAAKSGKVKGGKK